MDDEIEEFFEYDYDNIRNFEDDYESNNNKYNNNNIIKYINYNN